MWEKIKSRTNGYYGILVKSGIVLVLLCTIVPIYRQNGKTGSRARALEKKVRTLKNQVKLYEDEIEALNTDPVYVEYLLRHELHYGYKNEYILKENSHGRNQ